MPNVPELIAAAAQGDRFALGRLFQDVQHKLEKHIERNLLQCDGPEITTADVLSETLAKATRYISPVKATSADQFFAWLKAIADRYLHDQVRRVHRARTNEQSAGFELLSQEESDRALLTLGERIAGFEETPAARWLGRKPSKR
jgi:DNA-directed RNA polymerase specialized sigma24 family protein